MHNVHDVHELTFVLMKSLYLTVKDGTRVHIDAVVFFDIFCKANLVLIFDVHKLLLTLLIVHINAQFADMGEICDPVVADLVGYPGSQQRVSVKQESSLSDTVGLVVELLRHHLIEIFQFAFLEDIGMQACHAVDGKASGDGKMSHAHLSVIEDCHLAYLFLVARIFGLNLHNETAVNLLHDLIYTRKQSGEQLDRPFLKSLCHDGVVGVRTGLCGHIPRLFPCEVLLIHENTHQLGNCHRRMSIIQLEGHFLMELTDIIMSLFVFLYRSLHGSGDEEILLFQTKLLTCHMVIVRVKHFANGSRQVFLLHCFLILTLIKRIQIKSIDCFRIPDSESIHDMIAIAHNRHIIRYGTDALISFLHELRPSVVILHIHIAAELHLNRVLVSSDLKWIAVL